MRAELRVLVLSIFVAGLTGCGEPSVEGIYTDENDSENSMQFFDNGTWTAVGGGLGGTYTVDKDTIVLNMGAGGLTMTGKLDGDRILLEDRDLLSGQRITVALRKR